MFLLINLNLNIIQSLIYIIVFLPALLSVYIGFFSMSGHCVLKLNNLKKKLKILSIFGMFFVCFLSYALLYVFLKEGYKFSLWVEASSWIKFSNMFDIHWSFNYDFTTAVMFIVVSTISFLVHCYSLDYMKNDENILRFLSYLSLFTFFMLLLVSSANFVQLFIGWEGVGICSYLLINFWYTRVQANKAALKAVLVNKIGDCSFIFALGLIYNAVHSFDFTVVIAKLILLSDQTIYFLYWDFNLIGCVCFFLFLAAMAKSALFGFHTWLPDAMEGPTPVSALLHAATMVVAGVYLLIRLGSLFSVAPDFILNFIVLIGGLTCFFGASVALVQYDIKKIIAYSTCSQLGYMVLACGLGHYSIALFHLTTHAFFKALLFLCAGVIIHFLNDEQDLRKMGGLIMYMPITFTYMLIGSLALSGFPFLSGFYSKEMILELAYLNLTGRGFFAYGLGLLSAFFTTFYSIRLLYSVFLGSLSKKKHIYYNFLLGSNLYGDSNSFNTDFPLFILVLGSLFAGYFFQEFFVNFNIYSGYSTDFWMNSVLHSLAWYIKDLPFFLSFCALFLFLFLNTKFTIFFKLHSFFWTNFGLFCHKFLLNKWYIDSIYNTFIIFPLFNCAYYYAYLNLDKGWLEFFGPSGISHFIFKIVFFFNKLQSGYIDHYIVVMLVFIFFFIGGLEFVYFNYYFSFFSVEETLPLMFILFNFQDDLYSAIAASSINTGSLQVEGIMALLTFEYLQLHSIFEVFEYFDNINKNVLEVIDSRWEFSLTYFEYITTPHLLREAIRLYLIFVAYDPEEDDFWALTKMVEDFNS